MWFGTPDNRAAVEVANAAIRNTDNFHWSFIAIFTIIIYIYMTEIKHKNYRGIAAGLSLYMVHWFYEILNAIIGSATGYALWTVSPESTSIILLIGVSWELSMMFAVAGLVLSKLLPEDKDMKILGMNNRVVLAVGNAAFFSLFEVFLASTPAFLWVYPWWGTLPVFITTYIPFFLASFLIYDKPPKTQIRFIGGLAVVNIVLLVVLIPMGVI